MKTPLYNKLKKIIVAEVPENNFCIETKLNLDGYPLKEIIKRKDINLEDVLIAYNKLMKSEVPLSISEKGDLMCDYKIVKWQLGKSLENQSDELGEFLLGLVG